MQLHHLIHMLDKGGFVMVILMLLSIYVLAVIIYKTYQLWSLNIGNYRFIDEMIEHIDDKNTPEAKRIVGNQKHPIARVLEVVLGVSANKNIPEEKRRQTIEVTGKMQMRPLETHLRMLEMIASIAPLLGLLGTVIGMVKAFSAIETMGASVDPSMLAGGIWEALLTTIAGLCVAIPALATYHIIENKLDRMRHIMQDSVMLIMSKL